MSTVNIPSKPALLSPMGWLVFLGFILLLGVVTPLLNLYVPVGHTLPRRPVTLVRGPPGPWRGVL